MCHILHIEQLKCSDFIALYYYRCQSVGDVMAMNDTHHGGMLDKDCNFHGKHRITAV